ncbi:hypothetical protein HPT25_19940 [Bacillus sp. BRMEA1]|uniref:hypothetical protein n=1 Tax=Neobacillus endophyticus TaxID=2738405 RepID=UPI0015676B90|nr:hypothetical protein [Neobacillus endophyticus]NRD79636.1 hypothetical protein [Neobacillus endophyticus]
MSNLDFLEVNPNFTTYYRTLRDANYYFFSRPELQDANEVIAQLILKFIQVNGTTFRDMDPEEYERIYRLFEDDLLDVIINSGTNNVDFQAFTEMLDEIIGIARLRDHTLRKINRTNQEIVADVNEIVIIQDDDTLPNDVSEIYVTISDDINPSMIEDENTENSLVLINQEILEDPVENEDMEVEDFEEEDCVEDDCEEEEDVEEVLLNEIIVDEMEEEDDKYDSYFDDDDSEEEIEVINPQEIQRPYIKYRYENS